MCSSKRRKGLPPLGSPRALQRRMRQGHCFISQWCQQKQIQSSTETRRALHESDQGDPAAKRRQEKQL